LHVPLQQQPPSQTQPNQTAIKEPTKGKGLGRYKHLCVCRHTQRQTDRQTERKKLGRKKEFRKKKKKKVVDETTT
jgi:hypothetical protein